MQARTLVTRRYFRQAVRSLESQFSDQTNIHRASLTLGSRPRKPR
jgi:hypothetical protein